ncbi:alpha/beta hydrolase [Variovorax sp. KK3]|uniref:lipase family alpha/beta hydrolase n=1 Tax=Variovorax sp. KK3 TaxID=1855728 RepID=UPI00097BFCF8|nr:alpha/beta hydrolase [Variovorax sp. KK3]
MNDELQTFLLADGDARDELLRQQPAIEKAVESWMGAAAYAELRAHAGLHAVADLAAGMPKNVIFAPGVMGSTLHSKGLGGVWWLDMMFARDKLNGLALAPGGTNDADADADIRASGIDVQYVSLRRAIAASASFGGSQEFPYDWRKSFAHSAAALRDAVLDCHKQTGKKVHLVAHSMGGLMVRSALMLHGDELWPKIEKVVFVGTPHYGSPSIAGYLKNHLWGFEALAVVGMFLSRETFRSLPGVLSLLPAPVGVYPGTRGEGVKPEDHPCANFDMYDATAWKLDLDAKQTSQLQSVLDEAAQFHRDLYRWHNDELLQTHKERMLMIAGVGQEGLFRMEFDEQFWGLWERTRKHCKRVPGSLDYDGDGRVPLASAQLEDVTIRYVNGVHGGLTGIPAVQADVLAWLEGGKLKLPTTPKGALGAHLSAADTTSQTPVLDGSAQAGLFRDLPDYEHPTPQFRADIEKRLAAGAMPEVNLARLL